MHSHCAQGVIRHAGKKAAEDAEAFRATLQETASGAAVFASREELGIAVQGAEVKAAADTRFGRLYGRVQTRFISCHLSGAGRESEAKLESVKRTCGCASTSSVNDWSMTMCTPVTRTTLS